MKKATENIKITIYLYETCYFHKSHFDDFWPRMLGMSCKRWL